jgi:putative transposase
MPRSARLDAPGVLHHVIGRGIERRKIFLRDRDRNDFLSRLAFLAQDESLKIYAWSLLPDHFHLLCKTEKCSLASSMRRLLTGYVVNFNKRHGRHGHLFQNRYKSIVCQEDLYLQELVRYIHLNLLRAGLVKDLEALNHSAWSGHSALLGTVKRDWQDTTYILSLFGRSTASARRAYLEFLQDGIPLGRRPEFVGGGLIRSLGSWSSVLAVRKRGERQAADTRILGDGEFVQSVLTEMDELQKENLRVGPPRRSLSSVMQRVCEVYPVTPHELRSGSRRREAVAARRELSQAAVALFGYSGAEVARYLGVTTSCVTRVLASREIPGELDARYVEE